MQNVSAVSGEVLLAVVITPGQALVPFVRKAVAAAFVVPYFATVDVLLDCEVLVDDVHSWHDCHCPDKVSVAKKPRSLEWAQDVFEAIDLGAEQDLRQCLGPLQELHEVHQKEEGYGLRPPSLLQHSGVHVQVGLFFSPCAFW